MGDIFRPLFVALVLMTVWSCNDVKPTPVTWEDIAETIPSNPSYLISVNADLATDSALNLLWADKDVIDLIGKGLALDSIRPSHFVVIDLDDVTYVTWPLPNPRAINKKTSGWPAESLNNTVDANMIVQGNASLVVSSTQAWVVNSENGASCVNNLLSAAMNTKSVHVQPYAQCITKTPSLVNAVIPYNGLYYTGELNHEDGLMRLDVDAFDKLNRRQDIVTGFGRLPQEFIDQVSDESPFAGVEIDRGTAKSLMMRLAKLSGDKTLELGARILGPSFEDAEGTVVARWDENRIQVKVPFVSEESADITARKVKKLVKKSDYKINIEIRYDTLIFTRNIDYELPGINADRKTPHWHSQTENPCAIAFARLNLTERNPIEVYFELAPTHARLQIDYKESKEELQKVTELIKRLVFKTL